MADFKVLYNVHACICCFDLFPTGNRGFSIGIGDVTPGRGLVMEKERLVEEGLVWVAHKIKNLSHTHLQHSHVGLMQSLSFTNSSAFWSFVCICQALHMKSKKACNVL